MIIQENKLINGSETGAMVLLLARNPPTLFQQSQIPPMLFQHCWYQAQVKEEVCELSQTWQDSLKTVKHSRSYRDETEIKTVVVVLLLARHLRIMLARSKQYVIYLTRNPYQKYYH